MTKVGFLLPLLVLVLWNGAFVLLPYLGVWLAVGGAAVLLLALSFWIGAPWKEFLALRPRLLALGVVFAAASVIGSELLYAPLARAWPALGEQSAVLYRIFGRPNWIQGWIYLPLIAGAEEFIFRGALLHQLEAKLPARRAALVAVAIYTGAHLASRQWALVALAALFGALWTALRSMTRSLWPGLISHVAWDLALLVLWPLR
jgi:membrane protease YdiL (CAAX protease family)